jgi:hypothetical protein
MSSTPTNVVKTDALPPNVMKPLPPGASDIYKAGMVKQQNEAALQQSLIGGIRRRKKMKKSRRIRKLAKKGGAAPVVVVAGAPSYSPNLEQTNKLNVDIAKLANENYTNSVFDKTVGGNQAEVAKLSTQQQNTYNGKGGQKKGGSPIWGCLSGGKKSRKHKKDCKCKTCKCKRKKLRKTRKLLKRHCHTRY